MRKTILTILVAGFAGICLSAQEQPYKKMAEELSAQANKAPMNVSVGNFLYEDTKLMSGFSAILRNELGSALTKTGKFKIISREKQEEVANEQEFQKFDIFDPDSKKTTIHVKGIDGIVRGKFYFRYPVVTVLVELLCLDGMETKSVKLELNAADIPVEIIPANLKESEKNIVDIRDRIKNVPHDFEIKISAVGLNRDFRGGDKVQFKVRAEKSCRIAVFCHQSDGSTVLLFPNNWSKDTVVEANTDMLIPKTKDKKFEIEVGAPFGSDVIQVIACTKRSALHGKMEELVKSQSIPGYRSVTRGLFSKAVDESIEDGSPEDSTEGKPQWSENHIVISTYK